MSADLYREIEGSGPDLVLLHGWGLHAGVWDLLLPKLSAQFRVTRLDLPGHGRSRGLPMPDSLEALAQQVMATLPPRAVLLGWSLGGLVALRMALDAPQRIRGLVLANTTPRFVTAPDWRPALPPEFLQEFADGLAKDYPETLRRFLSLQAQGDEAARACLRRLRESLFAHGEPDTASLAVGLELLRRCDLRSELHALRLPTLVLAGGYDQLTPAAASQHMAKQIPYAQLRVFPKSAHAPFISHADEFISVLVQFMRDIETGQAAMYRDVQVPREAGMSRGARRRERP